MGQAIKQDSLALWLGSGIASGVLAQITMQSSPPWLKLSFLTGNDIAIVPGILFGIVVAFWLWRCSGASAPRLILAALVVAAGWVAAVDVTMHADHTLPNGIAFKLAIDGLPGGLVGGLAVALAASSAAKNFRRVAPWVLTVLVATAAGALLQLTDYYDWFGASVFFAGWQCAVLWTLRYGHVHDKIS